MEDKAQHVFLFRFLKKTNEGQNINVNSKMEGKDRPVFAFRILKKVNRERRTKPNCRHLNLLVRGRNACLCLGFRRSLMEGKTRFMLRFFQKINAGPSPTLGSVCGRLEIKAKAKEYRRRAKPDLCLC